MRSAFRRLAALVPVFLILGCFSAEPETIQFFEGQFQALKPASWSMQSNLNDVADLQMGNRFKDVYCTVLTEAKVDFADDLSVETFSDLTRKMLTESLSDLTETGPKMLEYSGQPAVLYELVGSIDNTRIKYWHVSIESPTHFHQVVLWSLPSKFDANKTDFEAVLHSIRAVDGG
jgi:hypothetical protein